MYLWTVQLFIYFLINSHSFTTASPNEGEYAPSFFGRIGNWFRNLKDRIVGFFRPSQLPASQDNQGVLTNSSNVYVIWKSSDEATTNSPSFDKKIPQDDVTKNKFDISTPTEAVIISSSEKSIKKNNETINTEDNSSKNPQSAEVVEPSN